MRDKMIIDVDTGVDDAQAIMLAATRTKLDILGITVVAGNTNVDQACLNTLRVLKICGGIHNVSVYKGAKDCILGNTASGEYYHGDNGLGDFPTSPGDPGPELVTTGHAVNFLVDMANKYPGEITLVALAPLTNIALAIRLDPTFTSKLKQVVIMGGNIEGRGNIVVGAEFNFHVDPEAAYVVLNELKCPAKLISWETCLSSEHSWDWYHETMSLPTEKAQFIRGITKLSQERLQYKSKQPFWHSCDLAAMVVALDDSVVLKSTMYYCTVELKGELTRGQMVVDHDGLLKKQPQLEVITALDSAKIRDYFKGMLL